MIYIDTSCLLKLFRQEAQTLAVTRAIAVESEVIVSTLVELEMLVQLKAAWKSGDFTRSQWRRLEAHFFALRNMAPYSFRSLPGSLFQTALRQHRLSDQVHSRVLDRLHLAAMEELKVERLMTHDRHQAAAAVALGFQVVQP